MTGRGIILVLALGFALLAAPLTAEAQQAGKVYRLGFLGNSPPTTADGSAAARNLNGLIEGLRELGYVEGQNLIIERRYAEGRPERWPELAWDLVGLKVDVIVVVTTPAALAARRASNTIPIVAPTAIDPVAAGLATSLARPGGNVTGIATLATDVVGKQLELLKEAIPRASRVAILWNPGNPFHTRWARDAEAAARELEMQPQSVEARGPTDLDGAFSAIGKARAAALLLLADTVFLQHRAMIADLAAKRRLPAMYPRREHVEAGDLISYGVDRRELYRRLAVYVDKIEQPTKFELVIDMKTAEALGLTIQPSLLLRADQVIE